MAVVKNLMVRAGADFSGLKREMNKTQKSLTNFKKSVSGTMKAIGATLATIGIGVLIKESINAASELEGAMMGLQSILEGQGKSFNRAKGFIDEYIQDGLVPLTDAVTAYKNLAARGYSDEQIQTVMERLKDAASFGRQSSYALGEAVRSATEGLKNENSILVDNAGVTKNVSKMWQDYAKSIGKTTQELTQQDKIQAEVNGIIQETQWQVGDAAKYTTTYAGRMAALKKTLQDIKVSLGNAFMPIANTVLPLLQSLANSILRVMGIISQFSQALFGKSSAAKQAKDTQKQATAVAALGDATEKAGKQAKGAVAGFDEVNELNQGNSGGAGDIGAGTLAETEAIGTMPLNFDTNAPEVSTKIQEMANKVKQAFADIKQAFIDMGAFITQNKTIIVSSLAGIAAGFVSFLLITKWTSIVAGLKVAFAGLATAIGGISAPAVAISALIALLVTNLVWLWQENEKFRDSVIEVWTQIKDLLTQIVADMWSIIQGIWNEYGQTLLNNLAGFMYSIQTMMLTLWESFLKPIITNALEMLSWLWDKHLKGLIQQVGVFIIKLVNGALEIWNKFISPVANWMVKYFGPPITFVINTLIKVFGNLLAGVIDVAKGLFKALGGIIDFITGVFTGNWEKAWTGVKNIFGGIFDSLVGLCKVPLNIIIDALNYVIKKINSFEVSIPPVKVAGKTLFEGATLSFPKVPTIPKLAKGGITNGAMLAMIGDNPGGREVVSPLDDLQSMIANAVASAIQFSSSNGQGDVVLQLDGTTLARVSKKYFDKENYRVGAPVIQAT